MPALQVWQAGLMIIMTRQCNVSIGFARPAALETGTTKERIEKIPYRGGASNWVRFAKTAYNALLI
jgi:hypothetical protein